jgi:hypothetical protein
VESIVPFRNQPYSPDTLAMMDRVLKNCEAVLVEGRSLDETTVAGIRERCARIILGAVSEGQQDSEVLKLMVLADFRRGDDAS